MTATPNNVELEKVRSREGVPLSGPPRAVRRYFMFHMHRQGGKGTQYHLSREEARAQFVWRFFTRPNTKEHGSAQKALPDAGLPKRRGWNRLASRAPFGKKPKAKLLGTENLQADAARQGENQRQETA